MADERERTQPRQAGPADADAVATTDGDNEERAPDVQYRWTGPD